MQTRSHSQFLLAEALRLPRPSKICTYALANINLATQAGCRLLIYRL